MTEFPHWLIPAYFVAGAAYASVGHGGASAYLALLTLAGVMNPSWVPFVLILNLFVAGTSLYRYGREGFSSWRLLLPFAITSVPAAYLGGAIKFGGKISAALLALALFGAGLRFLLLTRPLSPRLRPLPSWSVMMPVGGLLGFLAGAVGIGGGVFLSPLVVLARWADAKRAAFVAAGFIVVNSTAGLVARLIHAPGLETVFPQGVILFDPWTWSLFFAALIGGQIGSWAGAVKLPKLTLLRVLGAVLLLASLKHGLQAF